MDGFSEGCSGTGWRLARRFSAERIARSGISGRGENTFFAQHAVYKYDFSLAARENLDNLIFVINCNLQRLDGPIRGNGKIIQELESAFRGTGWNIIKVVWGRHWVTNLP
uniref:Pyruvate dehydrogenase E1 component n=1 Tax=Candidatus Kentrum sp. FW TaxID=2126338 RepID=A0A450TSN9_9GAMM|nr:MAG: hypothetical protein BECKFW1821C_GA0114237_102635 [Candidatus Kentron sp. FW]